MADSDDEHDRSRSRDKFRRERSDYGDKSRSRGGYREKRTWRDDDSSRRRSRDDGDRDRRRYSPSRGRDWSPPPKRMRREGWEGFRDFPPGMMPYGMRPPWLPPDMPPGPHVMPPSAGLSVEPPGAIPQGGPRRQTMLSFKQFLTQQDDSIDESEATAKYNEYKIDFKRTVVSEFFEEHKDEDWLISRYHPVPMEARKAANATNLQARLAAFMFLLESGRLDKVPLDYCSSAEEITKAMDTAVIKMEGGSDHDLLSLDQTFHDEGEGEGGAGEEGEGEKKEGTENKPSFMVAEPTEEQKQLAEQARDYGKHMQGSTTDGNGEGQGAEPQEQTQEAGLPKTEQPKKPRKKKQKDVYSYTEGDESEGSTSESEREDEVPGADEPPPPGMESADVAPPGTEEGEGEGEGAEPEPPPPGMEEPLSGEAVPTGSSGAVPETGQTEDTVAETEQNGTETSEEVELPPPNPLHVTRSVYIRHIPPKIAGDDIVEVCRTIPGYLRIAFADPAPERGYERRGWVTYKHDTDIMDVCARLSTENIKDAQLNCMVNRDLTRRVKQCPLGGVAWAQRPAHSDLHLALKLISALDRKNKLWEYASPVQPTTGESQVQQPQSNPVLSIPDSVLMEEEEPMAAASGAGGGAEEEEGIISDPGTEIVSNEDEKVKTLDRLVWYLRIVHSVDYYNATVFPSEDNMPHRCGIITARGPKPQAVTQEEVSEYVEAMGSKVGPLLETHKELTDQEMEKYGKKDPEAEVKHFMEVNIQKLSESKYLCPLSGKKFKGPEFVRKHILNKHMDKVDACRQEAEFFNNYLRDQDRPMPLEPSVTSAPSLLHPSTPSSGGEEVPGAGGPGRAWGQSPGMMFGGGFSPNFPPGMMGRGQFRVPRFRGGRRGRGRKVIQYHDLDAPEDMY